MRPRLVITSSPVFPSGTESPLCGSTISGNKSGFGHAVVIDDASPGPEPFEHRARAGNAAAWFTGDDDRLDCQRGNVEVFLPGDFGQPDGIGWRAAHHVGAWYRLACGGGL